MKGVAALLIVVACASAGVSAEQCAESARLPVLDGVVKGVPLTTLTTAPYVASLEFKKKHICSAAIVDKKYALTAAHCVFGVSVGDLRLRSGSASSTVGGKTHDAKEVIIHPDYNPAFFSNDIALIKVSTKFSSGQKIKMLSSKPVLPSASAYAWSFSPSLLDSFLRYVNSPTMSTSACAKYYPGASIDDSMICAGLTNNLQCQGDAGSPLVSGGKLLGIASFGYGCSDSAPAVFASVPAARKWIKKYTDDD